EVPGNLVLVDHSIFRTFHKGSLGILRVSGPENRTIYSGRQSDSPYNGEHITGVATAPPTGGPEVGSSPGERTFLTVCAACHQRTGLGIANVFPPLAGSDFLAADATRAIRVLLQGFSGPVDVNGQHFNGAMPPLANLSDQEIADVLTWVRSNLGNASSAVTPADVAAVRAAPPVPITAPAAPAAPAAGVDGGTAAPAGAPAAAPALAPSAAGGH
ncbi:MAG: c-type cytochrome, partial [Deltaproteobacteria bacterium]